MLGQAAAVCPGRRPAVARLRGGGRQPRPPAGQHRADLHAAHRTGNAVRLHSAARVVSGAAAE